jgi:hypothetical protein
MYKEQERLVLAGFTVQHFCLLQQKQGGKSYCNKGAENTHQDKHFNYNSKLNILGIL